MKHSRSVCALVLVILAIFPLLFCGCGSQQRSGEPPSATQQESETPPPASQQEERSPLQQVTFLFFSDTQADPETGDYSGVGELLSLAVSQAEEPDLVIFGGDTVNDGGDADEWREFWEAAGLPLSGLYTAAAPGNHDNYPMLAGQFDYPVYAPAGQGEGFFYSLYKDRVHFIMLDSNIMGAANDRDIQWLREDLQSASARQAAWRVAVMHHPMWPAAENPKDAARAGTMREFFLPLMEENGVDLILCGHQHVYARSLLMSGNTVAPDGNGIVQIMAASGGKESYSVGNPDYIVTNAVAPNYLYITADEETLKVIAYDGNGKSFDTFTIAR